MVEETATCTLDGEGESEGTYKYSCSANKNESLTLNKVSIGKEVTLDEETLTTDSEQINFSEGAALAVQNLQEQTQVVDEMYNLKNGKLTTYSKYFLIKGDIADYGGKVGEEHTLVVYDNTTTPSTPQNVSCVIQSVTDTNYQFKCTPTSSVKGSIYDSKLYKGSTAINLEMDESNDYVSVNLDGDSSNSTTIKNNPIYRKSSSGLSGGAIAGIVIACAVVLIIASIIAIMLRKPVMPVNKSSSVVGLRTVDNYTE